MTFAFQVRSPQQQSFYAKLASILVLLSCLTFITHSSDVQANVDNYVVEQNNSFSLQPFMQLPSVTKKKNKWLQLIAHPVNSQQYYARNKQGQIYLIEQETKGKTKAQAQLLLDFTQQSSTDNTLKTLNAFTLHPNFHLKEQQGFVTFYTAHTEATNKSSSTKRIQERNAKLSVSFDGVITEWQLDLTNPNKLHLNNTREILRITLPNAQNGIKQLSFNPYAKSWNDNFSLLYIALDSTDSLSQFPLYSGVILRINPEKFGMNDFTIPATNPFLKNKHIHNSFYLVGTQHIQQFIWPDKNKEQLLISHQYQSNNNTVHNGLKYQWLSLSQGGEDWRENTPKKVIYKSSKQLSDNQIILYRGRNTPALHNKLLILQKSNNQWQLSSLNNANYVNQSSEKIVSPQIEWPLSKMLTASNSLQFYTNNKAELLFLQQDIGAISELFQDNIQLSKAEKPSSNTSLFLFIIILFTSIASYLFYQTKVNNKSAKATVRRQFAHISLDEEKQAVDLFKRHQKTAEKSIELEDIKQCQILLSDNIIGTIDDDAGKGFSDQHEQTLRDIFNKEHTEKMIDGKIRRINMVITDKKHSYITCLYLRKGSDRITKRGYYQVIDDLIDWCWLFANKINPDNTGNRKAKPKISIAKQAQSEHKLHDETPLHKQAAIIRPATHKETSQSNETILSKAIEKPMVASTTDLPNGETNNEKDNDNGTEKNINTGLIDAELVNALEKLVKLKQQGFLTPEEFSQAKAKLLKNLISE